MKLTKLWILAIEAVVKLPMPKTLQIFFYKKLEILAFRSVFEHEIPLTIFLQEKDGFLSDDSLSLN